MAASPSSTSDMSEAARAAKDGAAGTTPPAERSAMAATPSATATPPESTADGAQGASRHPTPVTGLRWPPAILAVYCVMRVLRHAQEARHVLNSKVPSLAKLVDVWQPFEHCYCLVSVMVQRRRRAVRQRRRRRR